MGVLCGNVCDIDTGACSFVVVFRFLSATQLLTLEIIDQPVRILFGRVGTRWISQFIRLTLYAMFLLPGFIQGICPYHSFGFMFFMM